MTAHPGTAPRKANGASATASNTKPTTASTATNTNTKSAAKTASSTSANAEPRNTRRQAPEGEKIVIRRLPPNLSQDEFHTILGDDWKPNGTKVGVASFHPGKVSKDPSKPSRPAFATLHVLHRHDLELLSEAVRTAPWFESKEAREAASQTVLAGPPSAEFAIYKKVPSGRRRSDSRQGTIDQDPEFMAFLESLANPGAGAAADSAAAAANNETFGFGEDDSAKQKPTSTPLVDFLREKKAQRAREAAANAKSSRRDKDRGDRDGKGKNGSNDNDSSRKRDRGGRDRKDRDSKDKERGGRDGGRDGRSGRDGGRTKSGTVKILMKKADSTSAASADGLRGGGLSKSAAATAAVTSVLGGSGGAAPGSSAAKDDGVPKSRRAGILAAARILQRDLGLSPGDAHRRARAAAAQVASTEDVKGSPANTAGEMRGGRGKRDDASPTASAPSSPVTSTSTATNTATATPAVKGRDERSTRSRGKKGEGREARDGRGSGNSKDKETKAEPAPVVPTKILLKKKDDPAGGSTVVPTAASAPAAAAAVTKPKDAKDANAKDTSTNTNTREKKPDGRRKKEPSNGNRHGFIKHANPSQGVTEPLLKEALQAFGPVASVEIDRRKGFAFVEFSDAGSLSRAIAGSPITIAQAAVQVLERKDRDKGRPEVKAKDVKDIKEVPKEATKEATKEVADPSDKASVSGSVGGKDKDAKEKDDGKRTRRRGGRGRGGRGDKDGEGEGNSNAGGSNGGGGGRGRRGGNGGGEGVKTG